ncbi:hypothetical protein BH695_4481 [Microcystis aeruginosa PCC 7806SL]|uniref:Uncharacterized protein n=1 Tax=Microcystis aeruginosa PCC 7806SL TaxID=1903187 RepID=A0AB33BUV8_MICA7|nr:hypothetical protein BH695_4481 [Microcystis aeruginosa PCC 7806SL]
MAVFCPIILSRCLLLGKLGFLRVFENDDLIILTRLADELQARFRRKY